ncbi:hypothetical protein RND71_008511 [Anisodus tanguticus]|uniref:Uncharacterized protein n=1 Tax=Anisodus tanguticus TaxID=243964 RepID=A0AAE1SPQ0_9SOLA|nr:hypothetical protein RND71_008511 [Anisodus tanguticus]
MFCSSMVDVANELGIPPYIFFTSGADFLGFVLYLSVWHSQNWREFSLTDSAQDIPVYANLVTSNVLPSFALNNEGYTAFRNFGVRFKETRGILINTFSELEPHALNSLASDPELPPVYTIGPNLDLEGQKVGVLEVPQLQELAIALEQSGVRFLWSINVSSIGSECSSKFDEVLPEGFLSRTKERGMINAFLMVKDLELVVELKLDYRMGNSSGGIVTTGD